MYTGTDNWQNDRETILNSSSSLDERIPIKSKTDPGSSGIFGNYQRLGITRYIAHIFFQMHSISLLIHDVNLTNPNSDQNQIHLNGPPFPFR